MVPAGPAVAVTYDAARRAPETVKPMMQAPAEGMFHDVMSIQRARLQTWIAALALLALLASACTAAPAATPEPTPETSETEEATPEESESEEPTPEESEASTGDELDFTLDPNFGSTDLTAGFTPDPFTVAVVSGGPIDAEYLDGGCDGWATAAPDYQVTYTSGDQSLLRFYFVPDTTGDATLIINTPDGEWVCGDDSFEGLDPTVDFDDPEGGRYDVWIGSFDDGEQIDGELNVTELESNHP